MTKEEYYDTNYELDEIEVDPRFVICEKEMKLVFSIQLAFTTVMITLGYFLGRGDPKDYTYILGMPTWWFVSIVTSFIFFGIIVYVVKFKFQDMSLDDTIESTEG
ncbi:MAG: YhdT family protein [Peptostreptococcaceae bacterium]|nr:YhdT family protein [Peptostreptococcaceae bacterium]